MLLIGVKKNLKWDHKVNIRKAASVFMPAFSKLLFSSGYKLTALINKVLHLISKFDSIIRPNRHFVRHFNKSKHPISYKRYFFY